MERAKSLSITSVKIYKTFTAVFVSSIVVMYIVVLGMSNNWASWASAIGYVLLIAFVYWPRMKDFFNKIKEVSYDKENLYVKEGAYEIQIPFYDVKDIEILSLDGLYKFKLYHHDQFGDEVICKPSLWYPINFRKVDAELNRIRSLVRKAHREYADKPAPERSLVSNLLQ